MPVYEISIPGRGTYQVESPNPLSDAAAYRAAMGQADMERMADPTAGMGAGERFAAGAGKAVADIWRGAKQIAGTESQAEVDEAKRRDAPLMRTGAGAAGNIAGGAALFAPTAFVPGANTYTGAALAGAAMGALQPTAEGESRLANTAFGAGAGTAGQAAGNLIGRAIRPVASRLSPEQQALASAAQREGIPLTAGQATGSRPLQITESVLENLPLTSGPQLAGREAQQRAFTAAALRRAGIGGDSAGAGALLGQKQALGGTLGDIAERNAIDFNAGLTDRLAAIVDDAAQHLPPDAAAKVSGMVDKVLSQVDRQGVMSGTNYQGWREPLRSLASKGDETGRYFSQIRGALDDAFKAQLQGGEAEAFGQASRQYANLKTIMGAMGGAGNLPAAGQIAPAQLGAALARSVGREGRALGRGDLNEIARIGQTFVREQVPNSGTAQRQMIQALLTSAGGAGAGGGTALAMGRDPVEGMAVGAGIGAGALVAPRVAQALMNSPAGQAYLTRGLLPISDAERAALAAALRLGAVGSVPALGGAP